MTQSKKKQAALHSSKYKRQFVSAGQYCRFNFVLIDVQSDVHNSQCLSVGVKPRAGNRRIHVHAKCPDRQTRPELQVASYYDLRSHGMDKKTRNPPGDEIAKRDLVT